MRYKAFTLRNFRHIPQIKKLSAKEKEAIEIVGTILPFKANNYLVDHLIDWNNYQNDPFFHLVFPQKSMLSTADYQTTKNILQKNLQPTLLKKTINQIRRSLNPNPAGQSTLNVPHSATEMLHGIQHKYKETILFFPSQGQTCHAYCTFCFRWPQFVGMHDLKFAMKETQLLVEYIRSHPEITDIIFTGGDPMIMNSRIFGHYIDEILAAKIPHLQNIRIGSKALAYWPYRFTTDKDADEMLFIFEKIIRSGINLSFMAHFSHPREMETTEVEKATARILNTGAQIRTQSPIMRKINDDPRVWASMWKKQVSMGMIPYYMFIARDTGAQDYFAVSLLKSWQIYKKAYAQISGIARTVRGPVMSTLYGKIQILGLTRMIKTKLFALQFLQGRNPDWVRRPFFSEFNPEAFWIDDLRPAFEEEEFFFEPEFKMLFSENAAEELNKVTITR